MASVGADDGRTVGARGTRAAAAGQESEACQGRKAERRDSGAGGEGRAARAQGCADPTTSDPTTADPYTPDPKTSDPETAGPQTSDPRTSDPETADPKTSDPETAAAVAAAEAAGPSDGESVRVDSWIWSVRLVKTRSIGAAACRGGHVRVNGERVKPAHSVRVGDEVRLRHEGRERIVVVKRLIRKRVGAPVAVQCYIDTSPPPPPREAITPAGVRDRGTGRPTKRDRRDMERLRGLGAAPGGGFGEQGRSEGSDRSEGSHRSGGRDRSGGRGRSTGRNSSGGR